MPLFKCSYAYDVPSYFDFTVEAQDEREAENLIEAALKAHVFDEFESHATPNWESTDNSRVFVSGECKPEDSDNHQLKDGKIVEPEDW